MNQCCKSLKIDYPNLPIIFPIKATTSNISANEIPNRGFLWYTYTFCSTTSTCYSPRSDWFRFRLLWHRKPRCVMMAWWQFTASKLWFDTAARYMWLPLKRRKQNKKPKFPINNVVIHILSCDIWNTSCKFDRNGGKAILFATTSTFSKNS
jgi:hypothetical protein